jgi:leucyl aminopeptidase
MSTSAANRIDVVFAPLKQAPEAVTVLLAGPGPSLTPAGSALDEKADGAVMKSAEAAEFKGKAKSSVELLAPRGLKVSRLILTGTGKTADQSEKDWTLLGGHILAQICARKAASASILVELPGDEGDIGADKVAAIIAFGAQLRHYKFAKYKTKKSNGEDNGEDKPDGLETLVIHCASPKKAEAAYAAYKAIANGVNFARDVTNEPANVLGPVEFAERTKALEDFGVKVEILDVKALEKLKMHSLLAVGQGSVRPSRVAVMIWEGAKSAKEAPIAFVGKGVVFDTGGISIKPAAGMEDMKGDMGGAACVVGLMRALAERKAKVNAIGVIGCVENMPSGNATRPGDIVTSMSGQTIEVLNTDAEGRLVLADILWYTQERFKPQLVVDLATLTGAIMIALGKEYAGLYSNNDKLVDDMMEAAEATGEKVWRMPLGKYYDKLIDSKNADVKNLGGRWGGACTAAQFLKRFVKDDTVWAHIDLAGTAMDGERNDINQSWGSGWGVRLLNQLVADKYEGKAGEGKSGEGKASS